MKIKTFIEGVLVSNKNEDLEEFQIFLKNLKSAGAHYIFKTSAKVGYVYIWRK